MKVKTRTVVTLVEVHTRETGDATVKGVSKVSDDSTLSRKVWINGEEVYAEQYPTRCIDKFAQPELQAFVEMLSKYEVPRKRSVYLSTGFYKTLCIVLITTAPAKAKRGADKSKKLVCLATRND